MKKSNTGSASSSPPVSSAGLPSVAEILAASTSEPPLLVTEKRVAEIASFWQQQKNSNLRIRSFVMRNWRLAAKAAVNHLLLPRLEARLSNAPQAKTIEKTLKHRLISRLGAFVLPIPAHPNDYSTGSSKQTLRRKVRAAQKAGVTWRSVDDPAEQHDLVALMHRVLPTKSRYRNSADHSFLVGIGPWTVAYGPSGDPLVVAITPYDGEWALLQGFVSLGETQQHSDARYLLTQVIVERLSALGVRYLVDNTSPHHLSAGLWHFHRMIGFSMARVQVVRRDVQNSALFTMPVLHTGMLCFAQTAF